MSNARHLLILSVLALSSLALSGCFGNDAKTPCAGNDECASDEACVSDLCEVATCDPACEVGFSCEHGVCESDVPPECVDDAGCDTGFTCESNVCECGSDSACGAGAVCDAGACRTATPCTSDTECAAESRICDAGLCIAPCTQPSDCGSVAAFWLCETGKCIPLCPIPVDSDALCPAGLICEDLAGGGGVCRPADCATLVDCTGPSEICSDAGHGRCVVITPCTDDSDCTFGERCGLPATCPPGYDCSAGNEYCIARDSCNIDQDCPNNGFCDRDFCFDTIPCAARADCPGGMDCVGGLCVPFVCRGVADCTAPEICSGGSCITAPPPPTVDRVDILTPGGVIGSGDTRQLIAVAYDASGNAIIGAVLVWSTSAQPSVDVDTTTGLITGGATPGTATLTATLGAESDSVNFSVLPTTTDPVRVTVVDGETGLPVDAATVQVQDSSGEEIVMTGTDGVAGFTSVSPPVDIHVYDANHDYVSVFGLTGSDFLITLPPRSRADRAAGVTGSISDANVSTSGDASMGLAGVSLGGALADIDPNLLFGDVFRTTIDVFGQSQDVDLPGGLTAEITLFGITLPIKSTYYGRGLPGLRTGWAFAGKLEASRFTGGGGAGQTLSDILPLFSLFEHGLSGRLNLADRPTIVDTADIDGDGDTAEMVPDWLAFPQRNHAPAQAQILRLNVDPPTMPSLGGTLTDTVILLAGVRSGVLGLVPLGLSATETGGAAEAPAVTMKLAPLYGGLEVGKYQLLAMAVNVGSGGAGVTQLPSNASVRVVTAATLPQDIVLGAFLAFPENSSWNASTRELTHVGIANADLARITFRTDAGAWIVMGPSGSAGGGTWTLPAPPTGMDDLVAGVSPTIGVIELDGTATYEGLLDLGGTTLFDLDEITAAYARVVP